MTKNRERKLKSELELPPVLQAVKLYEPSQLTLSSSFCPENAKDETTIVYRQKVLSFFF